MLALAPWRCPAFSQQVRGGQALKASYVKVLGLITAAQWPALVMLVLLADPIVRVLLGPQWQGVVPVLQILSGALLFSFPAGAALPRLWWHSAPSAWSRSRSWRKRW